MAYCNKTDLMNAMQFPTLCQLTVDVSDCDHIDDDKLNDCIRKADNFINGYLRGRFSLPLSTVPESIRDLSIQLTIYYLYERSLVMTMPENVKWHKLNASKLLVDIQKGFFSPFEDSDTPAYSMGSTTEDTSIIDTMTNCGEYYVI